MIVYYLGLIIIIQWVLTFKSLAAQYTVVHILVINIGICFASSYNVFWVDDLEL